MNLEQRIESFTQLGTVLRKFSTLEAVENHVNTEINPHYQIIKEAISKAYIHNTWFTESNVLYSLEHWSKLLTQNALNNWIKDYNLKDLEPKTIAIIMAGNIPLVGFHDFLSVLICGHKVLIKQSANDKVLLNAICQVLFDINSEFKSLIDFTEGQLTDFDAVIATGSNNTARYFDYYFGKYPSIIRKNRNSIAVLTGTETPQQLELLSDDIFRYYGLGCRNVSKLYVPKKYNFDSFFNAVYKWHPIIHEHKYANNYDYNKAVYLMSEYDMLDNGFLVLRESSALSSPIATLNFEHYNSTEDLNTHLETVSEDIQCIVAENFNSKEVTFGTTQQPDLKSYADDVDTVEFLLKI